MQDTCLGRILARLNASAPTLDQILPCFIEGTENEHVKIAKTTIIGGIPNKHAKSRPLLLLGLVIMSCHSSFLKNIFLENKDHALSSVPILSGIELLGEKKKVESSKRSSIIFANRMPPHDH